MAQKKNSTFKFLQENFGENSLSFKGCGWFESCLKTDLLSIERSSIYIRFSALELERGNGEGRK